MNTVDNVKDFASQNVSTPIVVSVVVGMIAFGGIMAMAKKSGVKALKKGASVAQGGK